MPLNATSPYDPALTGIGLLVNGKVSDAGRAAFVRDVVLLLAEGNDKGSTLKPIGSLFPIPPVAGPLVPNLNPFNPGLEPVFWFGPEAPPIAALEAIALADPTKTPYWHTTFIDQLYQGLANALDLPGNTPLFPIFDVSASFGFDLPIPFALPDLALKLGITLPKLMLKLAQLNIKLSLPIISIPNITLPTLPQLPPLPLLPQFFLGLFELPFKLLLKILVPPMLSLAFDLPGLPKVVFGLAFDLLLDLFVSLGLPSPFPLLPKALVATLVVFLKNVIAMVCVDIVANLLGTGSLALGVGTVLGLVAG